ncbi:uncharacterized protein LOC110240436, partial [Exaiptasia diaphana]|uniref:Uncharacterized protein n=1 Tax=Exaiptasia diaphana TaxID=2652724 RepID=A0A913XB84_EXADI
MGKNAKYLMITKAIPGPQIGLDQKTALLNTDKTANISLLIYQKITKMNISIQIYHMEECLPSKPKELIYLYRGCHYVSNYNKSLCCQFDPNEENSPPSTRKVSNLTYSPLQVTNDFQFNTTITWQPPTHSCPSVRGYTLQYGDKNDVIIFPGGVF